MMIHPIPIDKLRLMPKTELHLHLDGCVRPATLIELAQSQHYALPVQDAAQLLPYMQVGEHCGSLKEYLEKFDFVLPLLQTAEALERVAYEAVAHCAEQGCLYAEIRFAPQLHTMQGLTLVETIRCVLRGLTQAQADHAIQAQAIIICMRHHSEALNLAVVEAAALLAGQGVAAVDLAGDEASYPPRLFRRVFARARELGLPATIHAGEAAGTDSIREALDGLGAVRIGHGIRLKESPELVAEVQSRRVPLEMCPTSNIQTKAVPGWEAYPIREYVDRGLLVTVNTDNPTVSNTTLTSEYAELNRRFGFSWDELKQIALNGAEAAWLPEADKQALRIAMLERFRRLEQEMNP